MLREAFAIEILELFDLILKKLLHVYILTAHNVAHTLAHSVAHTLALIWSLGGTIACYLNSLDCVLTKF